MYASGKHTISAPWAAASDIQCLTLSRPSSIDAAARGEARAMITVRLLIAAGAGDCARETEAQAKMTSLRLRFSLPRTMKATHFRLLFSLLGTVLPVQSHWY